MMNEDEEISRLRILHSRLSGENKEKIFKEAEALVDKQREEEREKPAEEAGEKT